MNFFFSHIVFQIQTPFAPFVHPKLPLAARLGLGWGARPSRLPFPASRSKPSPKLNGAVKGWCIARAPACLGLRGQAQRDPAFARTEIYRITDISRPPESAVAAPALPAHSKIVHPKLILAAAAGPKQKTRWKIPAGFALRVAGRLGAVVADGFHGAAFLGFVAALFLVGRGRLLVNEGVTAVFVALEIVRGRLAAQVTVNALVVHVEFAGDVFGVFVSSVSHNFIKKLGRKHGGGATGWQARFSRGGNKNFL
jgi:hypothetical protein